MNKNIKKLINVVCSVILLICLGISFTSLQMSLEIKAKADTIENDAIVLAGGSGSNIGGLEELSMDEIPNDDGIMEYFKYMANNFPNNPKNFCVYVSFAMMLSYYNEYWDDNVVDWMYEYGGGCNCPSCCEIIDDCCEDADNSGSFGIFSKLPEDYNDFQAYEDCCGQKDFMLKLMETKYQAAYLYQDDCTVINERIYDVLEQGIKNIAKENYFKESEQIYDTEDIIESLNNYYPVLIGIDVGGGMYHALVAFGYDDTDGCFWAHNGYRDSEGQRLVKIPYSSVIYAYRLLPNENYEGHKKTHTYSNTTASEHTGMCYLNGDIVTEAHTWSYSDNMGITHTKTCVCGYTVTEYHNFDSFEHVDDEVHKLFLRVWI